MPCYPSPMPATTLLLALMLQTAAPAPETAKEETLAPAMAALRAHDPATALADLQQIVAHFPHDGRVLRLTAQAALQAGKPAEAQKYFKLTLDAGPANPWPDRLGLINAYALGGQWQEFDAARQQLTDAKRANDPLLAKSPGFVIEQFTANGKVYRAVQFPILTGPYNTRYRFFITPVGTEPDSSKFIPYMDLESDDIDQTMYKSKSPEKSEANRRYSLDSYPSPGNQGLLRFYDGEPTYEEVRTVVIGKPAPAATTQTAPAKP